MVSTIQNYSATGGRRQLLSMVETIRPYSTGFAEFLCMVQDIRLDTARLFCYNL